MPEDIFRSLPSVDRLLHSVHLEAARTTIARDILTDMVRAVIDEERGQRETGATPRRIEDLAADVLGRAHLLLAGWRPVINATGVILHTNLGRAPLSDDALAATRSAAAYGNLEFDLRTGERGSRQNLVAELLRALTGARAAQVTGNNASAVLLVLTALCRRREVVVSRGQAVEIGGGFRVPEILRQSGARLVEVGTTNRTRIDDFAGAITERTGALLHVHASNFRMVGFAETPSLPELAGLAHEHGVPLLVDNGSGALLDTAAFGLAHEPTPGDALAAGADLVTFSGDKLLGGPQAGIIVGGEDLVGRLARHPLARATRPDKLILAALAATLRAYVRGDAVETLPLWLMIAQSAADLSARARRFQERARSRGLELDTGPGESTIGGGSLPGETLPTTLLVLPPVLTALSLRSGTTPVIGRTRRGRVLLDLRTVPPDHEGDLLDALLTATHPRAC